ncbi:MAG: ACT domain-containing protein [Paenibacillaceae bacterium]|nr:ACT domain-containing protein [Paenibacillaceae bacterium]
MDLQIIDRKFSICKLKEISTELLNHEFTFVSKTDNELSLICETDHMPEINLTAEHGWRCFRIAEDASFEKYGMIAFLSKIIADEKTCILVVATYDTDYIFLKEDRLEDVKKALLANGCRFI